MEVRAIQEVSLQEISKEIHQGQKLFAVCLQVSTELPVKDVSHWAEQQDMQRLLNKYQDVFNEPSSLPLVCEVDHCIRLKEGTEPINVRPYRYAHFQKAEIKKQVHEMLNSGLIRPSISHSPRQCFY